jgi:hypothetical protein
MNGLNTAPSLAMQCAQAILPCEMTERVSDNHIGVCSALFRYHIGLHESISLTDPMARMCLCG